MSTEKASTDEQSKRLLATAVYALRLANQYPLSIAGQIKDQLEVLVRDVKPMDDKELEHYVTFN